MNKHELNLINVLNTRFPTEIGLIIITYVLSEKDTQFNIEKQVYYINSCISWNLWWSKKNLLNKKERTNYNIQLLEQKLNCSLNFFLFAMLPKLGDVRK